MLLIPLDFVSGPDPVQSGLDGPMRPGSALAPVHALSHVLPARDLLNQVTFSGLVRKLCF